MKKITEYVLITVVILLILVSVTTNLAPHLGMLIGGIGSGSMSPTLDIGTMVIANQVDPGELKVGDIIVFKPTSGANNNICHRIVEIVSTNPPAFRTKGDNYSQPDSDIVPAANVIGRVSFHLPALGYFVQFLKSAIGLAICLVVPCLIIIVICIRLLWLEIRRTVKEK